MEHIPREEEKFTSPFFYPDDDEQTIYGTARTVFKRLCPDAVQVGDRYIMDRFVCSFLVVRMGQMNSEELEIWNNHDDVEKMIIMREIAPGQMLIYFVREVMKKGSKYHWGDVAKMATRVWCYERGKISYVRV